MRLYDWSSDSRQGIANRPCGLIPASQVQIMEFALKLVQDCAKSQERMSLLWTGKAPNGTENGNK